MDLTKPLTKAAFKKQLASQPFGAIGELVYDFLYRQIITMDLLTGTRINEAQLAKELETSRSPVHAAVGRLLNDQLARRTGSTPASCPSNPSIAFAFPKPASAWRATRPISPPLPLPQNSWSGCGRWRYSMRQLPQTRSCRGLRPATMGSTPRWKAAFPPWRGTRWPAIRTPCGTYTRNGEADGTRPLPTCAEYGFLLRG